MREVFLRDQPHSTTINLGLTDGMLLRTNNLSVETLYSIDIYHLRIIGGSTRQLARCDPTK